MASQTDITLRPGEASPKDIALHAQPSAALAAQVTIYLSAPDATPANVVLRDPATQPAAGGDVTGALAATEGTDTASISGAVRVAGALSAAESGADTAAMSGVVLVAGTLSAAESGGDVAALAGAVLVAGVLDTTEPGSDSADFAGAVSGGSAGVTGVLAATESGDDTSAMAGTVAGEVAVPPSSGGSWVSPRFRYRPKDEDEALLLLDIA